MLEIGQKPWEEVSNPSQPLVLKSYDLDTDVHTDFDWHWHNVHQIMFCCSGAARLHINGREEVVERKRAIFIPRGYLHKVTQVNTDNICCVYLRNDITIKDVREIEITNLIKELYLEATHGGEKSFAGTSKNLIEKCLYDRIGAEIWRPLSLPRPDDNRLKRICASIYKNPQEDVSVSELASRYGLSERTLLRHAKAELNCSIHEWRGRCRVLKAIEFMSEGVPMKLLYQNVGYSSQSAFIATFKKHMGVTPRTYRTQILLL